MDRLENLEFLTKVATIYRKDCNGSLSRNNHMNDLSGQCVDSEIVDAILVDFINFVGIKSGIDYALYTSDLNKEE